jgi:MFS family permease
MSDKQSGNGNVFSALAYGDFRLFASSLLLTSMGVQLLQTAMLWQVYELTGSALLLGLSGLVRAVPHIVLSLAGGVIADRLNAVLVLILGALAMAGAVEVWHLYLITFLNSAFTAVTQPARTALIPSLVPQANLVNAVALNATIGQSSQIIGPALAGVAIATVGLGAVYLFNGLLYMASMVAIIGVVSPPVLRNTSESPWTSFKQGMVFVRSKPVIISLLLLDVGATGLGSYRALLPIFAESLGVGAAGYGLLSAAPGIGSLIGAGIMLSLGDMKYKGLYTIFGVLAYCGALALLGLSPWFPLTLVAAALLGTTNSVQMIPRNTVILAISPDSLRGRVEAFRSMLAGGAPPLGYTLSGSLAAVLGAPLAIVCGAVACAVLVAVVGISQSALRDQHLGSTMKS